MTTKLMECTNLYGIVKVLVKDEHIQVTFVRDKGGRVTRRILLHNATCPCPKCLMKRNGRKRPFRRERGPGEAMS
jgi:hypothetical protein